ncbi:hypothetical protein FRC16_007235 [Serendipita sp. 398]|nr:hypothetical protein FRC16_007235 [Serendipita sp. 398]
MYSRKVSLAYGSPSVISTIPFAPLTTDMRRQSAAPFTLTLTDYRDEPSRETPPPLKTLIHPASSTTLPSRQDGTVFLRLGRKLSTLLPGHGNGKTDEGQPRRPSLKIDMQTEVHVLMEDGTHETLRNTHGTLRKGSKGSMNLLPPSPYVRLNEGANTFSPTSSPVVSRGYHYTLRHKSQSRPIPQVTSRRDPNASDPTPFQAQYCPGHAQADSLVDLSAYSLRAAHLNEKSSRQQPTSLSPLDCDTNQPVERDPWRRADSPFGNDDRRLLAIKGSGSLREVLRSFFGVSGGSKRGNGKIRAAKSAFTVARKSSLKRRKTKRRSFTEPDAQPSHQKPGALDATPNRFNVRLRSTPALNRSPAVDESEEQMTKGPQERKVSLPSFLSLL